MWTPRVQRAITPTLILRRLCDRPRQPSATKSPAGRPPARRRPPRGNVVCHRGRYGRGGRCRHLGRRQTSGVDNGHRVGGPVCVCHPCGRVGYARAGGQRGRGGRGAIEGEAARCRDTYHSVYFLCLRVLVPARVGAACGQPGGCADHRLAPCGRAACRTVPVRRVCHCDRLLVGPRRQVRAGVPPRPRPRRPPSVACCSRWSPYRRASGASCRWPRAAAATAAMTRAVRAAPTRMSTRGTLARRACGAWVGGSGGLWGGPHGGMAVAHRVCGGTGGPSWCVERGDSAGGGTLGYTTAD